MTYTRRVLIQDEELRASARVVGLFLRVVDDPMTVAQIADELGFSESTVLRSLRALEAKGWARRIHTLWMATEDPA